MDDSLIAPRGERAHGQGIAHDPHAVRLHAALDDLGGLGVLARQDARPPSDEDHLRSEPRERLGHLAADRAGADDDQAARARSVSVKMVSLVR